MFSFFEGAKTQAKPWITQNIPCLVHTGEGKFYHKLIRSQICVLHTSCHFGSNISLFLFLFLFLFSQISGLNQEGMGQGNEST